MNRYHKEVGFDESHKSRLAELTEKFNRKRKFGRTNHAFDRLRERFELVKVLEFLASEVSFRVEDVFEYYAEGEVVKKVCYRLHYDSEKDIIIVLGKGKEIVTVYTNRKTNIHQDLNREVYTKV